MINRNNCILIGMLAKAHGVNGALLLRLQDPGIEFTEEPESVFLELDGLLVPFFVEDIHEKSHKEWIIRFEGVDRPDKAGALTNSMVFADKSSLASAALPGREKNLEGYQVVDTHLGFIGTVVELTDRSNNPLLLVVHEGREFYIPFHGDLIRKIRHAQKKIYVETPEGLFDI